MGYREGERKGGISRDRRNRGSNARDRLAPLSYTHKGRLKCVSLPFPMLPFDFAPVNFASFGWICRRFFPAVISPLFPLSFPQVELSAYLVAAAMLTVEFTWSSAKEQAKREKQEARPDLRTGAHFSGGGRVVHS